MSDVLVVPAEHGDLTDYAKRRKYERGDAELWFHLAETSPNGAWVAKDGPTAIGVAIAHALEDEWFLCDLYVEPGFRGQGIGRRLLDEVAKDAGDITRSGLLDARETGALRFFVRRGVSIHTPVLECAGSIPREEELARMAAGEYRFTTTMLDPARHRLALIALDREVRGSGRPLDHEYLAARAHGVAFFLQDEFVGYAYVWPNGRVGPLASSSPAYLVQFFGFSLAALARVHGAAWCTMLLPGPNIRILRVALAVGLAIESVRLFASDGALPDLNRYVGFHPVLF
ncbi:MAG: GNAT family N-acetyltransferase [Candidatus Eremiobacteraeota bacterium]|nr:GNAT family N-acetyltransferase [Candidatus Eremiobacteraeota bacterium]